MNEVLATRLTKASVYCPFCAHSLAVNVHNELYCPQGDCGFAKFAADCIAEGLGQVSGTPAPKEIVARGYSYYCPSCRALLGYPEPGRLGCKECGFLSGRGLGHQLLERTVHK